MNADTRAISAVTRALSGPNPNGEPAPRRPAVPEQSIPSTASALPLAETALRRVLASQGPSGVANPTATALDLLRSVEALLRSAAPAGSSPEEIGAAAARLVERQGLLARLSEAGSASQTGPGSPVSRDVWSGTTVDGGGSSAVDTRL